MRVMPLQSFPGNGICSASRRKAPLGKDGQRQQDDGYSNQPPQ
jgi:hypothetical protein